MKQRNPWSVPNELVHEPPGDAVAQFDLGFKLQQAGRLDEAAKCYSQAIALNPKLTNAHYNLGNILWARGNLDHALDRYREAVRCWPKNKEAHVNRGLVLRALGRINETRLAFRKVTKIDPEYFLGWYNLGNLELAEGKLREAVIAYRHATRIMPGHAEVHFSLANAFVGLGQKAEAERHYRRVMELDPANSHACILLAQLLESVQGTQSAEAFLREFLGAHPDNDDIWVELAQINSSMCEWRQYALDLAKTKQLTERQIEGGQRTTLQPFNALSRPWSQAEQTAVARSWNDEISKHRAEQRKQLALTPGRSQKHDRLRVGYISQDFRNQAMGHLTSSLFALHDQKKVEIFGYAISNDDGSVYRKRIAEGCEHFTDISALSDTEAATRIRADGIDILVDLMGTTRGARLAILALKPAPVQVGWLRFPGSSGADFIDYMLTDKTVSPPEESSAYSEKLVYLPDCYQPNDRQAIDGAPCTRADFDLPDDAFVYCSFNNHYKIEPVIFDVWMRILHQVPGSVLWLLRTNPSIQSNLSREAEARGIAAHRLVFAKKIGKARHLARHRLADLFLDTHYYGAHTTGSDALWTGLPVLTCPGGTFAARVTASLLKAVGMPELIASDLDIYEKMAVDLACSPDGLRQLHERLADYRLSCPLFDTERFACNLERAYTLIWEDFRSGKLAPMIEVFGSQPVVSRDADCSFTKSNA